ncbi:PHD finger protein MALE MEIOCYTE DEATH 1 [Platanthera guangdongensis]|uniref:PHD finger protein MALE MEIOCYTE DEATH 1 n=1 Tax=Platanthera guangdongensis TaxID=2320717 RepID=A0ABR2M6I6_9ASPA
MHVENHLLHGILHLNGFGHLICINGYEGGSEFLSGHQIMDFWDRICTALQVRVVRLIQFKIFQRLFQQSSSLNTKTRNKLMGRIKKN